MAANDQAAPSNNSTVAAEENKFQKAISAWRNIDLHTLAPKLDSAASDLVTYQRDSLVQRKDLAQKTKDFRKLDESAKLGEVKGLLKAYQTYIDQITNQSKAIQSAFLQVYTPLSEAPDPYPLLEASVDSLVTVEETVPKLKDENEQLRRQVNKLTNDLEESDKRLEQERNSRQSAEGSQDDKIKSVEASWNAVLSEKQNNWEAKEKALEEKVEHQERLIKEIKASYEVSQRLNKEDGTDGGASNSGATAAELEIVHSELDRANMRLAEVEARNEQLRLELAQSVSQSERKAVEDDPAYLRLQSENSSLIRRFETSRFERDSERRRLETKMKALEREMQSLKTERDSLRQKLSNLGDYENMKQELEVLKAIEFATGEDDQEHDASTGEDLDGALGSDETSNSLEKLLLSRNKKLSSELTLLRISHQDMQSKLQELQEELAATTSELDKSKLLASTLESDLEKVQQEAANNFPSSAMSVAGTYTSRYPHSSYKSVRGGGGGRSTSPTSSIISGFTPQHDSLDSLRQGDAGSNNTILPMITAQRDRFKKKNTELEGELQKGYQTIQSLRSEVAALQKDNLNLYEKTRYQSSFNRSSPSATFSPSPNPTAIQIDNPTTSPEPTLHRYQSAYETNMSPFAAFRSRESSRAFRRMTVPERAVFQITRMVLATRASRNLFAIYCLGLHILVMMMLFGSAGGHHHVKTSSTASAGGPLAAARAAADS